MTPEFMLAGRSVPIPSEQVPRGWPDGWDISMKVDGIRAMLVVEKGSARLVNRAGRDISPQFPEVVAAAERLVPGTMVLDTELTAGPFAKTNGRAQLTQAREIRARALASPAELHVFDVLRSGDTDLRNSLLQMRRIHLERMAWDARIHPVRTFATYEEALAAVFAEDLEGVMLKRPDSRYVGRRSPDWIKAKRQRTVTCLVVGWERGNGSRGETFGALLLGLVDGGHVLRIGKVGSGFAGRDLAAVRALLDTGRPFAVEVAYLELSGNRQLRFPVFQRLRTDIDLTSAAILQCSVDQLT